MTNFIYIFMIISLLCMGGCIKSFNGEDSKTKTTVKHLPRNLKRILLVGKNVEKISILNVFGSILYLMFLAIVVGIFIFADWQFKVDVQYILSAFFLVLLFLETFIMITVVRMERGCDTKIVPMQESVYISQKSKDIDGEVFSKYIVSSHKRDKKIKGNIYLFPWTLFELIDKEGNIYRNTSHGVEYLSNVGAYKSLSDQLVMQGYQTIRFETKEISNKKISLEELISNMVEMVKNIQKETDSSRFYLIGHGITCNLVLMLQKKIRPQGMILLFGGGETGEQRILKRCATDAFGRDKKVRQKDVKRELNRVQSLIDTDNVVRADQELFSRESEFWNSILSQVEIPTLCISAERDWNYDMEEIGSRIQNKNIIFKKLVDVDFTMRQGFKNHIAVKNLTYKGYRNLTGKRKLIEGADMPYYDEKIGREIIIYIEEIEKAT